LNVLFVWPHRDSYGFKSIGVSLLSGIAKKKGWKTKLFDTTHIDFDFVIGKDIGESVKLFKPVDLKPYGLNKVKCDVKDEFDKIVEDFKPDCIAFSVLSGEKVIAAEIAEHAKKKFPDAMTLWGGKYPTIMPEEALSLQGVDFVCIAEGLEVFEEFLTAIEEKSDLYNIKNIWGKRDGKIIKNDIRPVKMNLDEIPYVDWSIFDKKQFYKVFNGKVYVSGDHMMNWGCPYRCTYCINGFYHDVYDKKYYMRRYSIPRIIDELKSLKEQYNLEFFKFHDEDFLMRPIENLRELSEAYRKEINLPFVIETNPKSVTEEKAELLANMNCQSASIAIETGDYHQRKKLLKRADDEEDLLRAFKAMRKYGIRTSAFLLLALPYETRETYFKTIEMCRKAEPQFLDVNFFYPFEGTELRDISIQEGLFDPNDKSFEVFRWEVPALTLPDLTEKELLVMRQVFFLYAKLPREYHKYIERSEKDDNIALNLRKRLVKIYDCTVFENDGWYTDDGKLKEYLGELESLSRNEEFVDH